MGHQERALQEEKRSLNGGLWAVAWGRAPSHAGAPAGLPYIQSLPALLQSPETGEPLAGPAGAPGAPREHRPPLKTDFFLSRPDSCPWTQVSGHERPSRQGTVGPTGQEHRLATLLSPGSASEPLCVPSLWLRSVNFGFPHRLECFPLPTCACGMPCSQ